VLETTERGSFNFRVTERGNLVDCPENVTKLRDLWLDRTLISRNELGPGVRDGEAWHISCHLVAAGSVFRSSSGILQWLEISHLNSSDLYYPSITTEDNGNINTVSLLSETGMSLIQGSTLLGYVEGTSEGRISARGVEDSSERFNGYLRQSYNSTPGTGVRGGKIWEHWCTTRNLSPSLDISNSLLSAYITLCAISGDLFSATVTRGRTQYSHPKQLDAMIIAGFTSEDSVTFQITPSPISRNAEALFHEATPQSAYNAVKMLDWKEDQIQYFMYERRISSFDSRL